MIQQCSNTVVSGDQVGRLKALFSTYVRQQSFVPQRTVCYIRFVGQYCKQLKNFQCQQFRSLTSIFNTTELNSLFKSQLETELVHIVSETNCVQTEQICRDHGLSFEYVFTKYLEKNAATIDTVDLLCKNQLQIVSPDIIFQERFKDKYTQQVLAILTSTNT